MRVVPFSGVKETHVFAPNAPLPGSSSTDSQPGTEAGLTGAAGVDFSDLYHIRPFRDADLGACRSLYREGLLGGRLAENDSGLDVDDVRSAYLLDPRNGFWVAEVTRATHRFSQWLPEGTTPGTIVGMVGVQHHEEGVGEIRRLRVHPEHRRRGLGSRLLESAIKFCRDNGSLKVQLDSYVDREEALKLFGRFGFRHSRTRSISGKDLLYFYLDLYTQDTSPEPR